MGFVRFFLLYGIFYIIFKYMSPKILSEKEAVLW